MLTEFLYFNSYDLNSSREERDYIRTQKRCVHQLHLEVPNFQFINCITQDKLSVDFRLHDEILNSLLFRFLTLTVVICQSLDAERSMRNFADNVGDS